MKQYNIELQDNLNAKAVHVLSIQLAHINIPHRPRSLVCVFGWVLLFCVSSNPQKSVTASSTEMVTLMEPMVHSHINTSKWQALRVITISQFMVCGWILWMELVDLLAFECLPFHFISLASMQRSDANKQNVLETRGCNKEHNKCFNSGYATQLKSVVRYIRVFNLCGILKYTKCFDCGI